MRKSLMYITLYRDALCEVLSFKKEKPLTCFG